MDNEENKNENEENEKKESEEVGFFGKIVGWAVTIVIITVVLHLLGVDILFFSEECGCGKEDKIGGYFTGESVYNNALSAATEFAQEEGFNRDFEPDEYHSEYITFLGDDKEADEFDCNALFHLKYEVNIPYYCDGEYTGYNIVILFSIGTEERVSDTVFSTHYHLYDAWFDFSGALDIIKNKIE